jgi:DsbC/DsbD-like thiol-disulfide interchange protein
MTNPSRDMALRTGRLLAAVSLLALATVGCGDGGPTDDDPVRVTVATDYEHAVPGESITLVWRFTLAPDWHLYWVGRNDSGFPPTIDLELPAGWIAGGLQWPAPRRHLAEGDILDHVYYDELVLLQKIGVPADAPTDGEVSFSAQVEWLGCKEACVPGKATVPVTIPLAAHRTGPRAESWRRAHDELPRPLPDDLLATGWDGNTFRMAGERGTELVFMPSSDSGELVNLVRDGAGRTLALRFKVADGIVGPVRGLVAVRTPDGADRAYLVDFPAIDHSPDSDGG